MSAARRLFQAALDQLAVFGEPVNQVLEVDLADIAFELDAAAHCLSPPLSVVTRLPLDRGRMFLFRSERITIAGNNRSSSKMTEATPIIRAARHESIGARRWRSRSIPRDPILARFSGKAPLGYHFLLICSNSAVIEHASHDHSELSMRTC